MLEQKKKSGFFKGLKRFAAGTSILIGLVYLGTVAYYRTSMLSDINVEDGEVIYTNAPIGKKDKILKNVEVLNSEIYEVNDITINLADEKIDISKIYELNQRYYIPLEEFLNSLNITFSKDDNIYAINDVVADFKANTYVKNDILQGLRGDTIVLDDKIHIALNDIENILGLTDVWDYESRTITLYERSDSTEILKAEQQLEGKGALLRLEDVSAGDRYITNGGIQSMKATADYLFKNNIKFHVAWIPRFKDPVNKIDNDLLENRSMANAQFINMLDYLVYRGGVIGLHGYTHQAGIYKSSVGSDLSTAFNNTEEETREIVEASIRTAKTLNIPYSFFESGHYHATKKQQAIIEEYVDACFEPYKIYWNFNPLISKRDKSTLYVPTPLSYVKTEDASEMVKRIEANKDNDNVLSALFFHPSKEMDYFEFNYGNGKYNVIHKDNSPLQNIVNALNDTNHITISINDLK